MIKPTRRGQRSYVAPDRDLSTSFFGPAVVGAFFFVYMGHRSTMMSVGAAHVISTFAEVIHAVNMPIQAHGLFF